jgi:uncharacterized membrane protein
VNKAVTISIDGVILLLCALSCTLLQNKLIRIYGKESLLQQVVNANKKGKLSLLFYILAIPLAFVSTWISGILFIAVALIWIVPDKRIESKINNN